MWAASPTPTQVENVNVELPESYYGDSMESYLGKYGGIEVWYNAKRRKRGFKLPGCRAADDQRNQR